MGKYFETNNTSAFRISEGAKARKRNKDNDSLSNRTSNWLKSTASYFGIGEDKDEYTPAYFNSRARQATELRKQGQSLLKEIVSSTEINTAEKEKIKKILTQADVGFADAERRYNQNPYTVKHLGTDIHTINNKTKKLLENSNPTELFGVTGYGVPEGMKSAVKKSDTVKELEGLAEYKLFSAINEGGVEELSGDGIRKDAIQRLSAGMENSPYYGNVADISSKEKKQKGDKSSITESAIRGQSDKFSLRPDKEDDERRINPDLDADGDNRVNIKDVTEMQKKGYYSSLGEAYLENVTPYLTNESNDYAHLNNAYELAEGEHKSELSRRVGKALDTAGYKKVEDVVDALQNGKLDWEFTRSDSWKSAGVTDYFNSIQNVLTQNSAKKTFEKLKGNTAGEITYNFLAAMDETPKSMGKLFTGDTRISKDEALKGYISEDLNDVGFKLPEFMGGQSIGRVAGDLASTTGRQAPYVIAGNAIGPAGQKVTQALSSGFLGLAAAGDAKVELLRQGYSDEQATAYGVLVGTAESTLQYLLGGISSMGGKITKNFAKKLVGKTNNVLARIAINTGTQMLGEFTEEALQEILAPVFKRMVGVSEEDIDDPSFGDIMYAGILGALSAGAFESGGVVSSEINTQSSGRAIKGSSAAVENLKNLGSVMSAESAAYKLVGKIDQNSSAYQIGRAFNEVAAELSEVEIATLTDKLTSKGMAEADAKVLVNGLQATMQGVELTEVQRLALENNTVLTETVQDLYGKAQSYNEITRLANEAVRVAEAEKTIKKGTRAVDSEARTVAKAENALIKKYADLAEVKANAEAEGSTQTFAEALKAQERYTSDENFKALADEYISAKENIVKAQRKIGGFKDYVEKKKYNLKTETEKANYDKELRERQAQSKVDAELVSVSDNGTTKIKATGEAVTIKKVNEDGTFVVNREDGTTVNVNHNEIDFESKETAQAYAAVVKNEAPAEYMTTIVRSVLYGADSSVELQVMQLSRAFGYGEIGLSLDKIKTMDVAEDLTSEQLEFAVSLGRDYAKKNTERAEAEIEARKEKVILREDIRNNHKKGKKGSFKHDFTEAQLEEMKAESKEKYEAFKTTEVLSQLLPVEIYVIDTKTDKWSRFKGTNGFYENGTVYVDINSEVNVAEQGEAFKGENTVLFTLSHELVHYIKDWSPEKFKVLSDFVLGEFAKEGKLDAVVDSKIGELKKTSAYYKNLSESALREAALEEVVAESCQRMLTESDAIERLAELHNKDSGLFHKLKSFIANFFNRVVQRYKNLTPQGYEAKLVDSIPDMAERMKVLFSDALVAAAENQRIVGEKTGVTAKFQAKWVPDMPKSDLEHIRRVAKRELSVTDNYIDSITKWLYNNKNGRDYFALYSTEDTDDPTILYASRNVQAEYEHKFLTDCLMEVEEQQNDRRPKTFDEVLSRLEHTSAGYVVYRGKSVEGRVGIRNVSVYSGTSRRRISRALLSCMQDCIKRRNAEGLNHADDISQQASSAKQHNNVFPEVTKFQAKKDDNSNGAWDNVSRANKKGELITSYYHALTNVEWKQFYNNLAEDGWLQETEVGTVASVRVGNKIIVAERKMRGKDAHDFIVDDVYFVSTSDEEIVTETVEALSKYITKWRELYDSDEIYRKSVQLCRLVDGSTILRRYDIINNRFVDDNSKGQDNEDVGDVFKGSRKEAAREGVSSGNQQDIQTDEGLKPTKFQRKSLDALSDSELLARHLEENSEAVGEILSRTADIEINPRVLNLLVNRKLKEYGISKEGRESVADVVPLLLDSAKIAAVKGGDITADLTSAIADAVRNTDYTENLHEEDRAEVVEALKGFKGRVYLNDGQAQHLLNNGYAFQKFRGKLFGKLNVVRESADSKISETPFTEVYLHLSEQFPNLFVTRDSTYSDKSVDESEYALDLIEKLDSLSEEHQMRIEDVFGADANEVATHIMSELVADVVQKKYSSRKNPYVADVVEKLRAQRDRAVKKERQRAAEKRKIDKAKIKERYEKREAEIKEKNAERREKAKESHKTTEMRNKVKKLKSEFDSMLLNPTQTKYVPAELVESVVDVLSVVNMDTQDADARVAKYDKMIAEANAKGDYAKAEELIITRENIKAQGEKITEKLDGIAVQYAKLKSINGDRTIHEPHIEEMILGLSEVVGDTPIRLMSIEQLTEVYDAFNDLKSTITNANRMFADNQKASVESTAIASNDEFKETASKSGYVAFVKKKLGKMGFMSQKPVYFFRTLGSQTFYGLYDNIRKAQGVWYKDVFEARDKALELKEKYKFNSWDNKKTYTFVAKNGGKVTLNLGSIMTIYALSRREQARPHIIEGGILLGENVKAKSIKGEIQSYDVNMSAAFNLSEESLNKIIDTLTEEQKHFVEDMQEYLSKDIAEKGNEVYLTLYDRKKFVEPYYFPIEVAEDFLNFKPEEVGETKIKNASHTKDTQKNANSPVVINDFMEVWSGHVNKMSLYHAFTLPLEDFNKVYNYKTAVDKTEGKSSIKSTLTNTYPGANEYITNFLKDLNGGVRSNQGAEWVNKLVGMTKKNAVFLSLSVAIQQPSAIVRSMAHIAPMHFFSAVTDLKNMTPKAHNREWQECKKWAPVAGIKEMGYFDTGMGASSAEWIAGNEYKGIKDKSKALVTDKNYRGEIMTWLPAKMDELAWTLLWRATKREIAHRTGLSMTNEKLLAMAGERFEEVVELTQVYDSVVSRSGLMRSKDTAVKMATSFMSEPTVQYNMLFDAALQGKRKGKAGKIYQSKVALAWAASVVVNAALKSLVTAMRDDDEDETYWEKYLTSLTANTFDGLVIFNSIPFVRDIVSILNGYDVERMDMAPIAEMVDSINAVKSDGTDIWEIVDVGCSVLGFMGVPAKNLVRDVKGIINTVSSAFKVPEATKQGALNAFLEGLPFAESVEKQKDIYRALVRNDTKHQERIAATYKTPDAYEKALKQSIREYHKPLREAVRNLNESDLASVEAEANAIAKKLGLDVGVVKEAMQSEAEYFNNKISDLAILYAQRDSDKEAKKDYTDKMKEFVARYKGIYTYDELFEMVKGYEFTKDTGEETDTTKKAVSTFSASDMNKAFDSGKYNDAMTALNDLVKTRTENNMRKVGTKKENGDPYTAEDAEKDAKSTTKGNITSVWKPKYQTALENNDYNEIARIERILTESGLYEDVDGTLEDWKP